MEALPQSYTWQDYRALSGDERWELIDGKLYAMSPSPSSQHQRISMRLSSQLSPQVLGSDCELFAAPMDVKLTDTDVVQPDLLVVCQSTQVRETHIEGAPSLVVEILSPSTQAHDRVRKLQLYARSQVKEYWIIQPESGTLEVLELRGSYYQIAHTCTDQDAFRSPLFPEWELDLKALFS